MNLRPHAGPASLASARIVLALACAFAALTGLAQWLASTPAWRFDSPVQFDSDFAVAVGVAWTVCQVFLQRATPRLRRHWLVATGAMLLLAAIQATDWLVEIGELGDDWLVDLPLWIAVSATLLHIMRNAGARGWAVHAWRLGVCFEIVFVACDFSDGRFVGGWLGSPHAIASLTE